MKRASETSIAWKILTNLNPDIALLQEVSSIPRDINKLFDVKFHRAVRKNGKSQQFGNAILVRGKILTELPLSSEYDWVNSELEYFSGNLLSSVVRPIGFPTLNIVSVYSPAWPIDTLKYPGIDITTIKLKQNPKLWVTEILWSALKNSNLTDVPWIVGGDLNSSETFDLTFSSGNREILDRMENLGFTECLRKYKGKLTPTFQNLSNGKVIHQMDHLFVSNPLYSTLKSCTTGDKSIVFGKSLSDHLPIIADFKNTQPQSRIKISEDIKKFILGSKWNFAKTMPEIPHYYLVKDNLSGNNKKLFDELKTSIDKNGYTKKYLSKEYRYMDIYDYKYWIIENILNREKII
jgi:exonuclease III